jgi:hypothetical protein
MRHRRGLVQHEEQMAWKCKFYSVAEHSIAKKQILIAFPGFMVDDAFRGDVDGGASGKPRQKVIIGRGAASSAKYLFDATMSLDQLSPSDIF